MVGIWAIATRPSWRAIKSALLYMAFGRGAVTVLTPLLTARAVAVEDGSAHARWLGRRWVGGWFFGGCSRRRLSRREGTAAQATALVGSCGAGRFARAAAMRRPA